MSTIFVKRQTEIGSRNWGVYRDGKLIEGGFFRLAAAEAEMERLLAQRRERRAKRWAKTGVSQETIDWMRQNRLL